MPQPNAIGASGVSFQPGIRMIDGSDLLSLLQGKINFTAISIANGTSANPGLLYESAQDSIVALAGGGQAGATQLLNEVNRIATVATLGDSVALPASAAGLTIMVINHGANPMQVFGLGSDQIDDQAAASGVQQMQGSVVFYTCATAGKWYSEGLATGYSGSFQTLSTTDTITASTTQTRAGAKALTSMINRVSTANASDAVGLPTSAPGMNIVLINDSANTIQIFPGSAASESTATIDGGTGGAATTMTTGKRGTFYCSTAGVWISVAGVKTS